VDGACGIAPLRRGMRLARGTKFRKVADMDRHGTRQPKTRQLIETALLNELRQCHTEWTRASHEERSAARERFMDALCRFNSVALYDELPVALKWPSGSLSIHEKSPHLHMAIPILQGGGSSSELGLQPCGIVSGGKFDGATVKFQTARKTHPRPTIPELQRATSTRRC
jgi:hypothetical protein